MKEARLSKSAMRVMTVSNHISTRQATEEDQDKDDG
jgi:hypothetical protein